MPIIPNRAVTVPRGSRREVPRQPAIFYTMHIFRDLALMAIICSSSAAQGAAPWHHGRLRVSPDGSRFEHADTTPFFWLADTGWLLPEKLDRHNASQYLRAAADGGFNVVQVQTINGVPATNAYGSSSHPRGWDFSAVDDTDPYGYWPHMDYIVSEAEKQGIYIGMVCIWGGLVKGGKMDVEQARAYGTFLAERYKNRPNIVWIIGGDIKGDVKPEVWETLATTIREIDPDHLMTFHPFGRTSSARWWHQAPWLDFDMFQSGHRRYDQRRGDGDDTAAAAVAEDNWRYVAEALSMSPRKPVIDGEPSYEAIPQGLHDTTEPLWQAADARRYAYWSVFAGAAGHTYGHNSVMQMKMPGEEGAYGATATWQEGLLAEGYGQMKHLRALMESVPADGRVPDQSVIAGANGERYDRAVATRGPGYIMVYTYTNSPLTIDTSKIGPAEKEVSWYDPRTGSYSPSVAYPSGTHTFTNDFPSGPGCDYILVIRDKSEK